MTMPVHELKVRAFHPYPLVSSMFAPASVINAQPDILEASQMVTSTGYGDRDALILADESYALPVL